MSGRPAERRQRMRDWITGLKPKDPFEDERQRLLRERDREREKAQRILMRSLRAGNGGFFETDTAASQTLGGSSQIG